MYNLTVIVVLIVTIIIVIERHKTLAQYGNVFNRTKIQRDESETDSTENDQSNGYRTSILQFKTIEYK